MNRVGALILPVLLAAGPLIATEQSDGQPSRPPHVQRLTDALGGEDAVTISRFQQDVELSDAVRGDLCVLRVEWSSLSPADQQARAQRLQRAMTELPASQRREAVDRLTAPHAMQIWWVPLAHHPAPGLAVRRALRPYPMRDDTRREIVHIGNDDQFAWYAAVGVMHWPELQRRLGLTSGDDPMEMALARLANLRPEAPIARRCHRAIADCGRERAVAAIDELIFDGSRHRVELVRAMSGVEGDLIARWLIGLTASPDRKVAAAARWSLLQHPRLLAADLYVAWLAEGAGEQDVSGELRACLAVNARQAAQSVEIVLNKPYSLDEYLTAFRFQRQLTGQPIRRDMEDAAAAIMSASTNTRPGTPNRPAPVLEPADRAARAIYVLTTTDDVEAAAALGIELAVCESRLANDAGLQILGQLPSERGTQLVESLASQCRDRDDVRLLKRLAIMLGLAQDRAQRGGSQPLGSFAGFTPVRFRLDNRLQPMANVGPAARFQGPKLGLQQVGPARIQVR